MGVTPLPKRLAVDFSQTAGVPRKIEGVALLNSRRLAVANDNDFNIGPYDKDGNTIGTGEANVVAVVTLDKSIK